jgi:hypothetical protein
MWSAWHVHRKLVGLVATCLVLIPETAHAEVMDKEPNAASLWAVALAVAAFSFFLSRLRRELPLLVVPVAIIWAVGLLTEINNPFVRQAIQREAGEIYIVEAHLLAALTALAPIACVLLAKPVSVRF